MTLLESILAETKNQNKSNQVQNIHVEVLDATPSKPAHTQENFLFSSMAFSGNTPVWGGSIGRKMNEDITPVEALKEGGLNFSVEKQNVYLEGLVPIPRHYAIVRTDTNQVLGMVGKDYHTLQNTVLSDIAESFQEFGAKVSTVGSVKQGRTCWMLLKLGDDIVLKDDDRVEKYMLITTSHDGSTPVTAFCTGMRVCCSNTLNMAISGAKNTFKLKVKHTSSAHYKLQQVTKLFSNVTNYFDKFEAIALAMQDTPFTQEQMKKLAEVMHPVPKKQPKKSNDEVLADLEKGKAILGDMVNRASSEQRAMDALINKEKISTEVPKRIQKQRDELVKLFNKGTGNSGKTAFDAINALTEGKQHNE
ncbi:MAG: DUF932 domain-containing protein, partial [Promethearchaeota archaeon]